MGITPVVIPAMPLGYSVGFYRYFFNCHQMLTLSLICMTTSASTTVEIFFWRWQNIILPNSRHSDGKQRISCYTGQREKCTTSQTCRKYNLLKKKNL
ncbi:G_PROTEIN_RECEP_F1_2 domain-containing protein [Caenorhabditis elegans]|uniref:G_PROTEIN_RECEP_F1_2 domain-containing protein n=1 Tax=Caenorhabditis elegans TaxID=6239 RepID=A0A4V0INL1_CAEEL|nr:G_PROTEIN_RECEP_F1_2 domain-containing protein [Caenorhabditis elegans]VTW47559.1 G_PROTEIN_RECEP_F1_2 domain-containing protein [Caenorhabditis elegans]